MPERAKPVFMLVLYGFISTAPKSLATQLLHLVNSLTVPEAKKIDADSSSFVGLEGFRKLIGDIRIIGPMYRATQFTRRSGQCFGGQHDPIDILCIQCRNQLALARQNGGNCRGTHRKLDGQLPKQSVCDPPGIDLIAALSNCLPQSGYAGMIDRWTRLCQISCQIG